MIKRIRKPSEGNDGSSLAIPDHLIPLVEARAAELGVLPGVAAAEMIAFGLVAFGGRLTPDIVKFLKEHGLHVPQRKPDQTLDPWVQDFIKAHQRPVMHGPKRPPKKHGLD